jgi:hypothetical protein
MEEGALADVLSVLRKSHPEKRQGHGYVSGVPRNVKVKKSIGRTDLHQFVIIDTPSRPDVCPRSQVR